MLASKRFCIVIFQFVREDARSPICEARIYHNSKHCLFVQDAKTRDFKT